MFASSHRYQFALPLFLSDLACFCGLIPEVLAELRGRTVTQGAVILSAVVAIAVTIYAGIAALGHVHWTNTLCPQVTDTYFDDRLMQIGKAGKLARETYSTAHSWLALAHVRHHGCRRDHLRDGWLPHRYLSRTTFY